MLSCWAPGLFVEGRNKKYPKIFEKDMFLKNHNDFVIFLKEDYRAKREELAYESEKVGVNTNKRMGRNECQKVALHFSLFCHLIYFAYIK